MIEAATLELGQVDILVNNAGVQHTAPVEQFPIDHWDAVIAINLSSNFHAIRAVIPQMRQRWQPQARSRPGWQRPPEASG
jgi:3-hydroxybutyrate dehydrogenase